MTLVGPGVGVIDADGLGVEVGNGVGVGAGDGVGTMIETPAKGLAFELLLPLVLHAASAKIDRANSPYRRVTA